MIQCCCYVQWVSQGCLQLAKCHRHALGMPTAVNYNKRLVSVWMPYPSNRRRC